MYDAVVIGGGAHGVLAALQLYNFHPEWDIALFERRIHLLTDNQPGEEFQFQNRKWTKNELVHVLAGTKIKVYRGSGVTSIQMIYGRVDKKDFFEIKTRRAAYGSKRLIVACGRDKATLKLFNKLGLLTRPFQPAAFQMVCRDPRLAGIKIEELEVGLSWVKPGPPRKRIRIQLASSISEIEPLKKVEGLISLKNGIIAGSAIHELSAYIAKQPIAIPERIKICINWLPEYGFQGILEYLRVVSGSAADKSIYRSRVFDLPPALWSRIIAASDIARNKKWKDLMPVNLQDLAAQLADAQFIMKPDLRAATISCYKGGIHPDNLHTDRPECLRMPGMYIVGSILDQESSGNIQKSPGLSDQSFSWLRYIDIKS